MFFGKEDDEESDGFSFFNGRGPKKIPVIEKRIEVSLEDLFVGCFKPIQLERSRKCITCDGRGGKSNARTQKCKICKGSGVKVSFTLWLF